MSTERVHLDMVALHFSTRCEAKCSFCYSSDPLAEKVKPTPIVDARKMLTKLATEGVGEVLFVGGDPVVHPNFIETLEVAKSLGLGTIVLSNTWSIKPDSEFAHAIDLIDSCEATVLGSSAKTHDAITQKPGSFVRLMGNLQRVAAFGRKVGVCANAMPQNLDEIYDIVANVRNEFKIPVRSLMIQRIIPSGGASGEFKFGLNLGDVERLMAQIDRVATDFQIPIHFEDPVPWCTVDEKYHKHLAKCQWGYTRGSMNSIGLLNRCGADDHYRLGSIWDGNVQEIWLNNPILQSFRSKAYLPNECKVCRLLEKCGGGCPLSCGTLKDHDVDQLYIQRIEREASGAYVPNAPSGAGYTRPTVRYAYQGDLQRIVKLEAAIFGRSAPIFKAAKIEALFQKCPKAFRVVSVGEDLLGYSVIFPLTPAGVAQVQTKSCRSIQEVDSAGLSERFGGTAAGYYLEVIATVASAPRLARLGLIRDFLKTVAGGQVPIFTCPISDDGRRLARKGGFVPLDPLLKAEVFVLPPARAAIRTAATLND